MMMMRGGMNDEGKRGAGETRGGKRMEGGNGWEKANEEKMRRT